MVQLTHALLPALKAEPGSHLVNVSSLFGLIAPAGQTAYAASKFAVRGLHRGAAARAGRRRDRGDLGASRAASRTRIAENARVGSGVAREEYAAGRAQFEKLLTIAPERAAEVILRGVERRRGRVLIGWSAKLPDLLARVVPALVRPAARRRSEPGRVRPAPPVPRSGRPGPDAGPAGEVGVRNRPSRGQGGCAAPLLLLGQHRLPVLRVVPGGQLGGEPGVGDQLRPVAVRETPRNPRCTGRRVRRVPASGW